MTIDCAFDEKLSDEIEIYLKECGFEITKEKDGIITTNDPRVTKDGLEHFLKKTGKIKELQIIPSDSDTIIIAKKVMIENFGLARCTICGFVAHAEELLAHERAHGVQLM